MATDTELSEINVYQFEQPNQSKKNCLAELKIYLRDYCNHSSIQGLNYFAEKSITLFERLWWLIILVLCTGGCIYMVLEIWNKYRDSPVLVAFSSKEIPTHQIPFPAVTICSESKIAFRCLNLTKTVQDIEDGKTLSEQDQTYYNYVSLLCGLENTTEIPYGPEFDNNFINFLQECSAMSLDYFQCYYKGEELDCADVLTPVITDEGLCYSYNVLDHKEMFNEEVEPIENIQQSNTSHWNPDDGYSEEADVDTYPRRVLLSGASNALVIFILNNKQDFSYSCRGIASFTGFRISLHSPIRLARPSEDFFNLQILKTMIVTVKPKMMVTSKEIKDYAPKFRQCYFSDERKLSLYKIYSQNNCAIECLANYTLSRCGCVPYFVPRKKNMHICSPGTANDCLDDAYKSYISQGLRQGIKDKSNLNIECNCMPMCNDLNYGYDTSTANLDFEKLFQSRKKDNENFYLKWLDGSLVQIFFQSKHFIPIERNELYGTSDLISNIGGILGLFTGFSLFSIAEILYFLTIRIWDNRRRFGTWAGTEERE